MKICLLCSAHEPYDKRVYHKIGLSLAAAGHDITVIAPGGQRHVSAAGISILPYTGKRRTIHRWWSLLPRAASLLNMFRLALRSRADAYQCNEPDSWLIGLLVKLVRVGCPRVVFDVHEDYPSTLAESFPLPIRSLLERLVRRVMRLMARFTDRLVLTRASLDDQIFAGIRVAKMVLPNCSRVPADPNLIREMRTAARSINEPLCAIHVGRMTVGRGSEQLLDALVNLRAGNREVRVVFVGGFFRKGMRDRQYEVAYLERASRGGVADWIRIVDWVAFERVPEFLLSADLGLITFLPSRKNTYWGLPHKLFDYMSYALPVIAPDHPEIARVVNQHRCGVLIDPTDPRAIADALSYLCDRPDEGRSMGLRGLDAVVEEYNWDKQVKKLLAVYRTWDEAIRKSTPTRG
jgi:glycosyltransferase involved in cell wall biosynthesis